jgi:hypothetical protein|tara:strand:- start:19 stop:135 length:117 start_codon:yes stop_codon:yes gene_type:complete
MADSFDPASKETGACSQAALLYTSYLEGRIDFAKWDFE